MTAAIEEAKQVRDSAVCIVLDTVKGQGVKYYEDMPDNHAPKVFEEGRRDRRSHCRA